MHVYFSGVGGVGIGPLALLALDAGYSVSGSDLHASALTQLVKEKNATVLIGQDGSQITAIQKKQPIDWFVHTSALPDDHPELVFARNNGIKTSKRSDFLNELLTQLNLKMIAVSGTHGKTTTTGMLVWLFQQLDIPVSYSVGTTLSFGAPARYQKGSEYFIYECDEFDRNFLAFHPEVSIITSLDYDHPDTYASQHDYYSAFRQFSTQSKLTVLWETDANKINSDANLFVANTPKDTSDVILAGEHNRRNAWLACTAINRLGLIENDVPSWRRLLKNISSFPGTVRRFEKLKDNLYTDYAHHPAEIKATIQMAQELNPAVVTVYQPHQNIRQRELLGSGGYGNCFIGTKKVYWLPTYLSREDGTEVLAPSALAATATHADITVADTNAELKQAIDHHLQKGDLVVAMSGGDLDEWLRHEFVTE